MEAYSSIGLVMILYVERNVSLYLPHLVEEIHKVLRCVCDIICTFYELGVFGRSMCV